MITSNMSFQGKEPLETSVFGDSSVLITIGRMTENYVCIQATHDRIAELRDLLDRAELRLNANASKVAA